MRILGIVLGVTVAFAFSGCTGKCEFSARCVENTLEVCSIGVDQMFGSPIHKEACADRNAICADLGPDQAACVQEPLEACDAGFVPRCFDGGVQECRGGTAAAYLANRTCGKPKEDGGPTCIEPEDAGARCNW